MPWQRNRAFITEILFESKKQHTRRPAAQGQASQGPEIAAGVHAVGQRDCLSGGLRLAVLFHQVLQGRVRHRTGRGSQVLTELAYARSLEFKV